MKIIIILSLFLAVSCVTSNPKARSISSENCNIDNYKDFIEEPGDHNCDLKGVTLYQKSWLYGIRPLEQREANFRGADLEGADGKSTYLLFSDFEKANLENADFEGAYLANTNFQTANLKNAIFRRTVLWNANLEEANLWGVNLEIANLKNANLRNAVLYHANLAGANLTDADLRGAKLLSVNLEGTIFNNTKVSLQATQYLKSKRISGFVIVE